MQSTPEAGSFKVFVVLSEKYPTLKFVSYARADLMGQASKMPNRARLFNVVKIDVKNYVVDRKTLYEHTDENLAQLMVSL